MKRRQSNLVALGILLVGAMAWLLLQFWTAPLGVCSHLLFGQAAFFEGHRIPVPWDMLVAGSTKDHLVLVRESPRFRLLRAPAGSIIVLRGPGPVTDMSKNYERIASANEQPPEGFSFHALRKFAGAKGTVFCWELASSDFSVTSVSCSFDNDTLAASFSGSSVYRERFYSIVQTISAFQREEHPL